MGLTPYMLLCKPGRSRGRRTSEQQRGSRSGVLPLGILAHTSAT